MKVDKYKRSMVAAKEGRYVRKRASVGERVIGSLWPSRGYGYPGAWTNDRIEMVSKIVGQGQG